MDLVNRLKHFMDASQVTISQFSDRCGIPRPTMSQLLNGRNKRISDEVINKIHAAYPNLSILWLMFGEGTMDVNGNIEISEAQKQQIQADISVQHPEIEADITNRVPLSTFTDNIENRKKLENSLFETKTQPDNASLDFAATHSSASKGGILFDETEAAEQPTSMSSGMQQSPSSAIPASTPTAANANDSQATISISPDSRKKITNIVVFYSDNSFQSFIPDA